jgi:hypothetical protein
VKEQNLMRLETDGLSACGVWVRRQRSAPSLLGEALCLSQVLQTWNLSHCMTLDRYGSVYAEISSGEITPRWVYLVEVIGHRLSSRPQIGTHPLSQVEPFEEVRIVAVVEPEALRIHGALVETERRRRLIWEHVPTMRR